VIADADRSLANFLVSALDAGTSVTFETPSEEWAKAVKRPAVSCFLHRVAEDIGRRNADWADERNAEGRVSGRQPPVRHYQLHYQVSAWAKTIEDEHRLLGRVMEACLAGEIVAPEHLAGALEGEQQPLLVRLGVPVPDPGPQAHDVWSSLGVPLRASLELTLVAPLRPSLVTDIAPPAEELTMDMERIGRGAQRAGAGDAGLLAERRWTAFRIREKAAADD
jgi:predicted transcriptional regulator